MSQEKKYDVFISYSRKDYDEVKAFVDMLKKRIPTIEVWMDLKRITVADEFDEKIISAIDASSYVIFAVSPNSNSIGEGSSKWTKKELVYAKNTDKKVIPVLLNGAKLNSWFLFEFGRTDCIDTTDTLQVEKLIENLSFLTNKPTFEEELRREKERREREAELARKEAELDHLRKEKELQERMAQAEAEKTAFDQEGTKKAWEQLSSTRMIIDDSETPTPKPTPNSRSTHKPIKKSWIWLTIAACAIVGLVIIGVRHFQQRSTILDVPVDIEPVDIEQEQLEIVQDSLRQDHIQDSIAKEQAKRNALPKRKFQVGDLMYKASEKGSGVTVAKYVHKDIKVLSIPSQIQYGKYTYDVDAIGGYAFEDCRGLTSITIPNSVTSIGSCAFYECSSLTSIVVEKGNKMFDSRENCNAIIETATNTLIRGCNSTIIPNSVTSIGSCAFYDCSSLTTITIPNSVTSIGEEAFADCSSLTSITIPNSVTSIGKNAFYGCSSLTSITIPNSVTSIGEGAFAYCSSLTSIVVEKGNKMFDSRENCNAIIETATNTLIRGCNSTIIPNSVTRIGDYAFSYCSSLTSMTIHNSVTSIGDKAFAWCEGLTSIIIPNSVTSIGEEAFFGCDALKSIRIPKSVTYISGDAFPEHTQVIRE